MIVHACAARKSAPDLPPPPGVRLRRPERPAGVWSAQFCLFAGHADRVVVCLADGSGDEPTERRVELSNHADGYWWGEVEGVRPGQRYGYRVWGPWDPHTGHRHNPAKLLIDPYAGAVGGSVDWSPQVFGHVVDDLWSGTGHDQDRRDSAGSVPWSVVVDDEAFEWELDAPPRIPWGQTVLYEAHVRGLTYRHPQIPEEIRGSYAALAHPAVIDHLKSLGVTSLELLPIHAFTDEPHLVQLGLSNYWGYNSIGFFAPHPAYASDGGADPLVAVAEVKQVVKALHAAGIEVILDVVYNHTGEQSATTGATLSLRGIDNASYYRLDSDGRDIDVTGCGNTVDLSCPDVVRMVLDSLRHWVQAYHVDGFRFDLAPALARGRHHGWNPDHPFLVALRADPVLSKVKLIAEPWDVGPDGWRTGQFPLPWREWNDRYRDVVRTFWLADQGSLAHGNGGHGVAELAARVAGSRGLFSGGRAGHLRTATASVNYIASHDGFPLADTTAYLTKHNEANGEENRDGHDDNRSWNHGVEGPSEDPGVLAARARSIRNLLGTLLTSAGVPMIAAGDEFGRTQGGNNNAYCQDNHVSWLDWNLDRRGQDLLATTRRLLQIRAAHPALRPSAFPLPTNHTAPGLQWFTAEGDPMRTRDWSDPAVRTLVGIFETPVGAPEEDRVLVIWQGDLDPVQVSLPLVEGIGHYTVLWDSTQPSPGGDGTGSWEVPAGQSLTVEGLTVLIAAAHP